MASFAELSEIIKKRLDDDLSVRSVEIEMPTLEEAVKEAAATLGIPVFHTDYEILERKTAFLSFGKNICKIRAYERTDIKRKQREEEEELLIQEEAAAEEAIEELAEDLDGEIFVKRLASGIHIKVTPPVGEGAKATLHEALEALTKAHASTWDEKTVQTAIKEMKSTYVRVADYQHNPANNSALSVDVTEDEMRAFLFITAPGPGGADITYEDIKRAMQTKNVIAGINEILLQTIADRPLFREKICIAKGINPVNGLHSYIQYFFEVEHNKIRFHETNDGKIDFKSMNIIQNVTENQTLAVWNPAEPGKDGTTVTGRVLLAESGKNTPLEIGSNVHVAEDGHTVLASISGQVVLINGKINVEPVLEVDGDVGLKTGNVEFNGTVFIKGNVIEGFTVKASGNIEINGTVDKSTLIAQGDIIVKQGIYGKEDMLVQSGRSLWAKFIENATVKAGDMVVVSDGIINSNVDAEKRILCQGKRACIVGGRLRASEEINCKTLGSVGSFTETICEVAYAPESRDKLERYQAELKTISAKLEEESLSILTLENQKKQRGELPLEKEDMLTQLTASRAELTERVKVINSEIEEIRVKLGHIESNSRVSASVKAFPGVRICIRDAEEKLRSEYKNVSFVLDGGLVRSIGSVGSNWGGGGGGRGGRPRGGGGGGGG
ncbi:MAG: FapA family protein, partial [Spirochaetaceae bacterium]|nr:FapA family protein [Spirochaetaceae bacterium]